MDQDAHCRPASVRSRCIWPDCATEMLVRRARGFVSHQSSCRAGLGASRGWMRCCRSSNCAVSRWATSKNRLPPCLRRMLWTCRRLSVARLRRASESRLWSLAMARTVGPTSHTIWADGVYLQTCMEPSAECILVLIGATPAANKELLDFPVGPRESAQSWRGLLVDLKERGLTKASPKSQHSSVKGRSRCKWGFKSDQAAARF